MDVPYAHNHGKELKSAQTQETSKKTATYDPVSSFRDKKFNIHALEQNIHSIGFESNHCRSAQSHGS